MSMNMFAPMAPASRFPAKNSQGGKDTKNKWISPFVTPTDRDPWKWAQLREGDNVVRLLSSSTADSPCILRATTVGVKDAAGISGAIMAGDWFFKQVQPFLMEHYANRFPGKKNPSGDVKLRTKQRVLFFASSRRVREDGANPETSIVALNLPGTNYPGAKPGIGEIFFTDFFEDFHPETGRVLTIRRTGSTPENTTYAIVPARTATPVNPDWIPDVFKNVESAAIPSLKTLLREPSTEEIISSLKTTLPADVFEALMADSQAGKL
jgi:hypothetical protein